VLAIGGLS